MLEMHILITYLNVNALILHKTEKVDSLLGSPVA